MFKLATVLLGAATTAAGFTLFAVGEPGDKPNHGMTTMQAAKGKSDKDQILEHIHGIFNAYLHKDREVIRRSHTTDWTGFGVGSERMVHGIDGYMAFADAALKNTRPQRYELLETDVQIYGDIAIVYYSANYWFLDPDDHEVLLPLRSVDVYRRDKEGWNQCGSNICRTPQEAKHSPSPTDGSVSRALSETEKKELLKAREAVWRACFANDHPALKKVLPPDIVAINSGESEWDVGLDAVLQGLEEFAKGGAKLTSLDFPKTEIQATGDTVVMYSTYEFALEKDGRSQTHRGRATEIFVNRGGHWLNSGWHLDSGS